MQISLKMKNSLYKDFELYIFNSSLILFVLYKVNKLGHKLHEKTFEEKKKKPTPKGITLLVWSKEKK